MTSRMHRAIIGWIFWRENDARPVRVLMDVLKEHKLAFVGDGVAIVLGDGSN